MFNLFTKKTDAQKMAEAPYNKHKYRIELLSDGHYSYSFLDPYDNTYLAAPHTFKTIDDAIAQVVYNTKHDERKQQVRELKRQIV